MEPKISDFHFAKREFELIKIDSFSLIVNELIYIAPELFQADKNTIFSFNEAKSVDVYAFAFILLFIFTGENPWNDIEQAFLLLTKITNNERPEFPSNLPKMIRLLIQECWNKDPKMRPSFETILYIIGNSNFMNNIEQKIDLKRFNEYQNKVVFNDLFFEKNKLDMVIINDILFPKILKKVDINTTDNGNNDTYDINLFFKGYETKSESLGFCNAISIKDEYIRDTNILNCFSSQIKIMLQCEHPSLSVIYGNANSRYSKSSSDKKDTIFDYFLKSDSLPVLIMKSFISNKNIIDEKKQLSLSDKFNILYGIAAALYHLHKREFVLLNLNPKNILLNADNKPIIFIDITARSTSDLNDNLSDIFKAFSYPYAAPEILNRSKNINCNAKKCDVYSFAMIIYYIFTEKHPFDVDIDSKSILNKIEKNEYTIIDEIIPEPFDKLMKECSQTDPLKRPSIKEILKKMGSQNFIDKYKNINLFLFKKYQKTVVDKKFIYSLIQINLTRKKEEFELSKLIGTGMFGCVKLAIDKINKTACAFKVYTLMQSLFFRRIIQILETIDFPSIIKIYCIIEHPDENILVFPYAEKNSLDYILRINKKRKNMTSYLLDYTQKCIILYGIAMRIHELHKNNIIHRHLNSSNILIDENFEPWMSGFSYAKLIDPDQPLTQPYSYFGTPIFMANELLQCFCGDKDLNEEYEIQYDGKMADIYSFGIIAYHLMIGIKPLDNIKSQFVLVEKISKGIMPEFPQDIEAQFIDLISKFLKKEPEKRPTSSQICKILSNPDFYKSSPKNFDKLKFINYQKKFGEIDITDEKIIETE